MNPTTATPPVDYEAAATALVMVGPLDDLAKGLIDQDGFDKFK